MGEEIFRNTCPRNCFGTCGILSHVKDGCLIKVSGDPKHGFTKGRLCAKGYAYTQFVYNPKRLKYPMLQSPRGSGNWKRISWDKAYAMIAEKMIELHQRYGSNLASGYNKYSGNMGLLHDAVEGMFNSIGPHTKSIGNLCSLTGKLAIKDSLGHIYSPIPEDMENASLIVLWGANPAVTNVHQMKFIFEAKRKGAKLVVIDPIFTRTAEKADLYIQINPGSDSWLAYGVAKLLMENEKCANNFIQEHTMGWDKYKSFIQNQVELAKVSNKTGAPIKAIKLLAKLYGNIKPVATWSGIGLQRNEKGRESINAISSLAAITGNLNIPFGGLYYMHWDIEKFPRNLLNHRGPLHPNIKASREIDICNYAKNALKFKDPPLKLLWIASRNIITQDQDINSWKLLSKQLELIVTVDLYLTKTAELSDIVLPAASHFEEEDLNVGYWHHWLSINQKAIPPYYEAKSDLQIARELTKKLNELSPSFSNFPFEKEPIDWIKEELTPEIMQLYSLNSYKDLLEGPHLKQKETKHRSSSNKYHLDALDFLSIKISEEMQQSKAINNKLTYRLLTPQSLLKIHSQYEMVPWLNHEQTNDFIELSPEVAKLHGIVDGMKIEVFNEEGLIVGKVKINPTLPNTVVLASQAGSSPINNLIKIPNEQTINGSSTFFYDSMVKIRKRSTKHV